MCDTDFFCYDASMNTPADIYVLVAEGKLEGFSGKPLVITTVISNVYVFENKVLKIYKRDNEWWNTSMQNLSGGQPRISFITKDFAFNQTLNPAVYIDLKVLVQDGDIAILRDPQEGDDELVIVMNKIDTTQTLTKVLFEQKLTAEDCKKIGVDFATKKLNLSKDFLPAELTGNWYEQLIGRFNDLEGWVSSVPDFPKDIGGTGLVKLRTILENQKEKFGAITAKDLAVCIDCNSENLLYSDHNLNFMDVYPPKNEWRSAAFDHDIFRVGADIYGFVGKHGFNAYFQGVQSVSGDKLDPDLQDFYLLYGAMITGPYLYMLAQKNTDYLSQAQKYTDFIKSNLLISLS